MTFSDGAPFTSADVLFSFAVAYDAPGSQLAESITAAGQRLDVTAPDATTVIVTFPTPFAPGIRLLDNLPILPRHKLEPAFRAKTIQKAWTGSTPLSEIVGLGPFVLSEHVAGQRLVFTRNPHYWRKDQHQKPLPYLDRLTIEIIPDQNAEALRLESGATDLMSNADIRPDDYARFKRLADQGRLKLLDAGVGLDPNVLWFNLKPPPSKDAKPWLRRTEFRQALSFGVDRQAIANTVYLGAAVPVFGPITPRHGPWSFDRHPGLRLRSGEGAPAPGSLGPHRPRWERPARRCGGRAGAVLGAGAEGRHDSRAHRGASPGTVPGSWHLSRRRRTRPREHRETLVRRRLRQHLSRLFRRARPIRR